MVEWMYDDIKGKVREEKFGGFPGSSAVLALVSLAHKWFSAMEENEKVVRIISLIFGKPSILLTTTSCCGTVRKSELDQHC